MDTVDIPLQVSSTGVAQPQPATHDASALILADSVVHPARAARAMLGTDYTEEHSTPVAPVGTEEIDPASSEVEDGEAEDADAIDMASDEADASEDEDDGPAVADAEPSLPAKDHAAQLPGGADARTSLAVPSDCLTVRLDPALLSESVAPGAGLFALLDPITRRTIETALSLQAPGYHLFVSVPSEVEIEDALIARACELTRTSAPPCDLVYVHNFEDPEVPLGLELPAGMGSALADALQDLQEELCERLPELADTEEIDGLHNKLNQQLEQRTKQIFSQLEVTARQHGFVVRNVRGSFLTLPLLHGKPLSAEQFNILDEVTKRALHAAAARLTREVNRAARRLRKQSADIEQEQDAALARAASGVIQQALAKLEQRFASLSAPLARYLQQVRTALTDNHPLFFDVPEDKSGVASASALPAFLDLLSVNLLVCHAPDASPPVLFEQNPTTARLFGHLLRRAQLGTLTSSHLHIRAGALHKARGGILVLRAADLLAEPGLWEKLKRALRERLVVLPEPAESLQVFAATLHPAPVALPVRVVLIGPADVYAALAESDPDFAALFRLKAEVNPVIERTPTHIQGLDAYLMTCTQQKGLVPFARSARARLIDLSSQLVEDRERLGLAFSILSEVATFASHAASLRTESVSAADIDRAFRERHERFSSDERRIRDSYLRGEVSVETAGSRVGVVNGLCVVSTVDTEFGQPMRISAIIALGREGIVDVEREAQLSGAIHTKGMAIVRGYLSWMFGQERPLSLKAQLVFEQSYGEIDGDSASTSELFAVLSALADIGIDQGIAVTGSVNQLGQIQAIGGVCAKIEGFYDLCAARGLTGAQGVLIPRANLPHLVLRQDVAAACAEGRFHVYAIDRVEQGVEILMGLAAGQRDDAGRFPAASLFGRVERRIIEIAERLRQAESHGFLDSEPAEDGSVELGDHSEFRRLSLRPAS